MQILYTKYYWY